MRQLNGIYTQAFNRAKRRAGHVFQDRYTGILVDKQKNWQDTLSLTLFGLRCATQLINAHGAVI
jgi:hypothetical protein